MINLAFAQSASNNQVWRILFIFMFVCQRALLVVVLLGSLLVSADGLRVDSQEVLLELEKESEDDPLPPPPARPTDIGPTKNMVNAEKTINKKDNNNSQN